jgi:hypothetical protein
MASWADLERDEPEHAERAKGFLDAHVHKTIATLRRDGSPRISGIEAYFVDGDLWFGSMPGAVKARDLQRDRRFALHSGSADPPDWDGDAKVAGRVEEIVDRERKIAWFKRIGDESSTGEAHLFRADVEEVAVVRLNDARDKLLIDSWRPGRGVRRIER